MGRPFLSRHFLSEQASCLASVPFAAAGAADEDGVATTHNLLALGTWSEDTQVRHQSTERHNRLAISGGFALPASHGSKSAGSAVLALQ